MSSFQELATGAHSGRMGSRNPRPQRRAHNSQACRQREGCLRRTRVLPLALALALCFHQVLAAPGAEGSDSYQRKGTQEQGGTESIGSIGGTGGVGGTGTVGATSLQSTGLQGIKPAQDPAQENEVAHKAGTQQGPLTPTPQLIMARALRAGTRRARVIPSPGPPNLHPTSEVFPICKHPGPISIVLDSRRMARRRWKGWGTTLAWFGNYVGGLPSVQRSQILDLLFHKHKGLGFNIARYNIGGGRNPKVSRQFNKNTAEATAVQNVSALYEGWKIADATRRRAGATAQRHLSESTNTTVADATEGGVGVEVTRQLSGPQDSTVADAAEGGVDVGSGVEVTRQLSGPRDGAVLGLSSQSVAKPPSFLQRWNALPGFKPMPGGPYNWFADKNQRACLLGARARGADTFLAVSFSPPWWMTVTGDVAGSVDAVSSNLRPRYYNPFANYLTEVVKAYRDKWGIRFASLEPVNEPNDGGWRKGGPQEGCSFSSHQMDFLYPLVSASLARKALHGTRLVGFDSWALTTGYNLARAKARTLKTIDQVHSHGYVRLARDRPWRASEQQYGVVRRRAEKAGKEVWMSEWTFSGVAGAELDLGMLLARTVIEVVNYMGASAFILWQAIDKTPRFSLVYVAWDNALRNSYPHVVTKKYWVMRAFTRFAPPGSIPLTPASNSDCEHCTVAFYNPATSTLAFFVVNQTGAAKRLRLSLKGFRPVHPRTPNRLLVFRTSGSEDFKRTGARNVALSASDLLVTAEARAFTTLVFTNVRPA